VHKNRPKGGFSYDAAGIIALESIDKKDAFKTFESII